MATPTVPESHAALLETPVALATVNPDGHPQITAVVVKLDADGRLHTSINTARQKYKNLVVRPQATVFAIDPTNPYRTLEIRADAELLPDPGKAWSTAFLPGLDLDAIDGDADRLQVVLTPVKVNALG